MRPESRQSDAEGDTLPPRFAATMAALGPWEPTPSLAIAVSGGADSTALALLSADWARDRGGRVLALIVDHGLRPESSAEAAVTRDRLDARGIPARILTVTGLRHGAALAERARSARYGVLIEACNQTDMPHLLLGHHALDQAETIMMRALGGSGARGLAGMAGLVERQGVRLVRPLLGEAPAALRAFLTERHMRWVEDPSNASPLARRSRLRRLHADPSGTGEGTQAILRAATAAGEARARDDHRIARVLAERVSIRPEGFAVLGASAIDPEALAALIRVVGGLDYPPSVADLARDLRPATVGGVRVLAAGRLGPGWLLVREARAMAPPVPAVRGAVWDRRFRLLTDVPDGLTWGPLGPDARRLRAVSRLPAAVLWTLPALRQGNVLACVPHLGYRDPAFGLDVIAAFDPPAPLAGAPFLPIPAAKRAPRGCETASQALC